MFLKKTVYYMLILLIGISCNNRNNKNEHIQLNSFLDSLKQIYAPDTRISLWNISIEDSSGIITLTGEVNNTKAFKEIDSIMLEKNPLIKNNLKLLPVDNQNQIVSGLINNSVANLRSKPKHSSEIVTQVLLGTPIKILKKEKAWYLIQTPNKYIAWVDAPAIVEINKDDLNTFKQSKKIIYNKQYGFSYSKPDINSQTISDLVIGCILPAKVHNGEFYIIEYPDKRSAYVKIDETVKIEDVFNKQIAEKELTKTAMKFLGIPYLWGGTSSKGIDCSGYTSLIYFMSGTVLQRDASQQIQYGDVITNEFDYKPLQIGDLLFFGRKATDKKPEKVTHVAMYIGDTEYIHASGKVRISSIDKERENYDPEYAPTFLRTVRIIGEKDDFGIQQISENEFYKEII